MLKIRSTCLPLPFVLTAVIFSAYQARTSAPYCRNGIIWSYWEGEP